MKLLFIRHGEPDYSRDCLTENGLVQAAHLAKRLEKENITAAFHSPMGRAAETAQICMDGRDIPLTMCSWLREFDVKVHDKDLPEDVPVWDILPANWTADPLLFDRIRYTESAVSQGTEIAERAAAAAGVKERELPSLRVFRQQVERLCVDVVIVRDDPAHVLVVGAHVKCHTVRPLSRSP